jgi:hypothetical protein
MSKQTEDTMYEIYQLVESGGLRIRFDNQVKKMKSQEKHKWKTMCEVWEYAYNKTKTILN